MRTHILILVALLGGCSTPAAVIDDTEENVVDTEDTGVVDTGDTGDTGDTDVVVGDPDEDDDNDGFTETEGDCDDSQPAINPYATDLVGDGVDQNCDGIDGTDQDGDGFASMPSGGDDCDDTSPETFPGATLDSTPTECMKDADGDHYGDADGSYPFDAGTDCDDSDNFTFPGAIEVWYDGVRQNCDDWDDPDWSDFDQDGDGFDWTGVGGTDCLDTSALTYPGAFEDNTDGVDNNCNGRIDQFSMSWTWDPTFVYNPDDGRDIAFRLEIEDVNTTFVEFVIQDANGSGADVIVDSLADTYFAWDVTPSDQFDPAPSGVSTVYWYALVGPSVTQTYRLDLNRPTAFDTDDLCYVWGYDPPSLDPDTECLVLDPTTL